MSLSQWKHEAREAKLRAFEDYRKAVAAGRVVRPAAHARQTEDTASRIIRGA